MCMAIPGKIKRIEDNYAFFDYAEKEHKADISLAPEVSVGDWVLMHDGRALSKITETEAKENLEFLAGSEACHVHD